MALNRRTALLHFSQALDQEEMASQIRPEVQVRCLTLMARCKQTLKIPGRQDTGLPSRLQQAEDHLNKALNIAHNGGLSSPQNPNYSIYLEGLLWLADNYRWQTRSHEAEPLYRHVQDHAFMRQDTQLWLSSTLGLAQTLRETGQDDEALRYYMSALAIASREGDTLNQGRAYLGLAETRRLGEEPESAEVFYKKALLVLTRRDPTHVLALALNGYARFLEDCYGKTDEAMMLRERASQIETDLDEPL